MSEQKTKNVIFSTTQIAGLIGSSLLVYNIYGRLSGQGTVELTAEEITGIATLVTPVVCNLWMMIRRMKGNEPLHIKPKKVSK